MSWLLLSPQSAVQIKTTTVVYRYFQFCALPYRKNERTECFSEKQYRKIAAFAPSTHRYFVWCESVFGTFIRFLRYLRSDIRFLLCVLFRRVLRSAPNKHIGHTIISINPKPYRLSLPLPRGNLSDSNLFELLKEWLCVTVVSNGTM